MNGLIILGIGQIARVLPSLGDSYFGANSSFSPLSAATPLFPESILAGIEAQFHSSLISSYSPGVGNGVGKLKTDKEKGANHLLANPLILFW